MQPRLLETDCPTCDVLNDVQPYRGRVLVCPDCLGLWLSLGHVGRVPQGYQRIDGELGDDVRVVLLLHSSQYCPVCGSIAQQWEGMSRDDDHRIHHVQQYRAGSHLCYHDLGPRDMIATCAHGHRWHEHTRQHCLACWYIAPRCQRVGCRACRTAPNGPDGGYLAHFRG